MQTTSPAERVRMTHFHVYGGSGAGAYGFQLGHARVGQMEAEPECLGSVDVDPIACKDFGNLVGVPATCLDLFDLEQYLAFHAHCATPGKDGKKRKRCRSCENTGKPPVGWREAAPADLLAAAQHRHPDIVFTSPPCTSFSGLLSGNKAMNPHYGALSRLTIRGVRLIVEAFAAQPPKLLILENVPGIETRGASLLTEIRHVLEMAGYAVSTTTHDCGELGGLAQHRRRFLLVARHLAQVRPFLYEPPKVRVRGVGEVLGEMPMPDDPVGGEMHESPRLEWRTWVRLALIPAGGDWRSLQNLDFGRYRIERAVGWHAGALGVRHWSAPAGTVTSRSSSTNGAFTIADPRPGNTKTGGKRTNDVYRVVCWDDPAGAVTVGKGPISGGQSIADPRPPQGVVDRDGHVYGVTEWENAAETVTGQAQAGGGRFSVADPRPKTSWKGKSKYRVTRFDEPAGTVIAASTTGTSGFALADPRLCFGCMPDTCTYPDCNMGRKKIPDGRPSMGEHANKMRVEPWEEPAHTVTGSDRVGSGALSVADPRPERFKNSERVVEWEEPAGTVTAGTSPSNGGHAVQDPRVDARGEAYGVRNWNDPVPTITNVRAPGQGAFSVGDPRLGWSKHEDGDFATGKHYGVRRWEEPSDAVIGSACLDNGAWSVADPRPWPGDLEKLDPVPIIIALDGTWHRPFTTLELAALQSYPWRLLLRRPLGGADAHQRQHIGNAVPPASAKAVASEMYRTLLLQRAGVTFTLAATPVWVRPIAVGLSLARQDERT